MHFRRSWQKIPTRKVAFSLLTYYFNMNAVCRHALIVDPDAAWRSQLSCALHHVGFHCETAADGMEASERLAVRKFDLLVTDLLLPRLHGHALIVQALNLFPCPRIVVLSGLSDSRLVRDILSRGVDDYFHKSTPLDLLTTKILALFELHNWQEQLAAASNGCSDGPRDVLLNRIERRLHATTENVATRLAPLFEQAIPATDVPSGVIQFAERMCMDERAAANAELHAAASTRKSERVDIRATGIVLPVDEQLTAIDAPAQVLLLDISTSGVRMMHTRSLPDTDLVLSWEAETIPDCTLRVPLSVARCRLVGRFYDIGGMFAIPPETRTLHYSSASLYED